MKFLLIRSEIFRYSEVLVFTVRNYRENLGNSSDKNVSFVVGVAVNPYEPQTLITPFAEPLRPAPVVVLWLSPCRRLLSRCIRVCGRLRLAELGTLRRQLLFPLLAAALAGCSRSPSLLKTR